MDVVSVYMLICLHTYVCTYVLISVFDSIHICLSGLALPASDGLQLFQSSPESGDGLPQLVDFLLLLGYLRLDAGRVY